VWLQSSTISLRDAELRFGNAVAHRIQEHLKQGKSQKKSSRPSWQVQQSILAAPTTQGLIWPLGWLLCSSELWADGGTL
jgi:hypothetical protein